jgi:hypothetical protein
VGEERTSLTDHRGEKCSSSHQLAASNPVTPGCYSQTMEPAWIRSILSIRRNLLSLSKTDSILPLWVM